MANLSTSELKRNIAAILKGADLNTLSSKKVRKQLEEKFETDLTDRKLEIDKMLMDMITAEQNDKDENNEDCEKQSSDEGKENSDSEDDIKPHRKKSKPEAVKNFKEKSNKKKAVAAKNDCYLDSSDNSEVDDEALARKLQEEERKSRSRAVKKNSGKKDSSKKGNKNDASKPKVRKGESSYTRKCALSPELANIVGANEMARHDVVKKMWSVVRERNLFLPIRPVTPPQKSESVSTLPLKSPLTREISLSQNSKYPVADPNNKQFAICDQELQSIFGAFLASVCVKRVICLSPFCPEMEKQMDKTDGAKRIKMFGMMKYLKNHVKDQK